MLQDFYTILGVTQQATIPEIKKAYRNLAKQYHPDVVGDNAEKLHYFTDIKNAYETLINSNLRYEYHEKRWLYKSEGKEIPTYKVTTAVSIYKDYMQLEKEVHFNNNATGNSPFMYANKISELLNSKNIEILNQKNDPFISRGIVHLSVKLIPFLPVEFFNTLIEKINHLHIDNKMEYVQLVEKTIRKQKKIFLLEKYKWVGVVGITILLLVLLKWMVH
jgi:curved DNA-binding protein CbpA